MSHGNINVHNIVSVALERQHFVSRGRDVESVNIVIVDNKDDRFTVSAIGDPGIVITTPKEGPTAPISCTLDMTRKFAANGLRDEIFEMNAFDGVSKEDIAEALVRYLESYGAKFQGEVA